jgi:hypothetical protein
MRIAIRLRCRRSVERYGELNERLDVIGQAPTAADDAH